MALRQPALHDPVPAGVSETYVVVPDIQAPFHDPRAVQAILDFIKRVKPDGLMCVGDEIDLPSVSRWHKDSATEYTGSLMNDVKVTHDIVAAFREALGKGKPFHMSRSNHGDRLGKYINKYAPALAEYAAPGGLLDIPTLVGYGQLGVTYHRQPFEFTAGWVLCHGDEGNLSPLAGRTATNLAVSKFGKSVVCGHTHRAGSSAQTTGVNGKTTTLYGVEVGHVMDLKKAHYMKALSANWQQACGLVEANGKATAALALPIIQGKVVMP